MAIRMVKKVLAATVPRKTNFDEGILLLAGMAPIGAGLHEPSTTCAPLVKGRLSFNRLAKVDEIVS
jgi:hypothetical protein